MKTAFDNPVKYHFIIGEQSILINDFLNKKISISWSGKVLCFCKKIFTKFYRQNFCYNCFWNLPQASQSIFKPELCTADLGIEERDLEWEKKFQLTPHYVYLANSSGLKIGITRKNQEVTRWMDQGAIQAIKIAEVPNRRISGLIEVSLKKYVSDKTNWRKMLSMDPSPVNLLEKKKIYSEHINAEFQKYCLDDNYITEIRYPILKYPVSVKSLALRKHNTVEGKLVGIKGQYLIFEDNRVFNVRAHDGYIVNCLF